MAQATVTALEVFFTASGQAMRLDALAGAAKDPREGVLLAARAELARIEGRRALQDLATAFDGG